MSFLKAVALALVLVLIPACASIQSLTAPPANVQLTTQEQLREKLATVEADYQAGLSTLKQMMQANLIDQASAQQALKLVVAGRVVMDQAHAAVKSGDAQASSYIATANLLVVQLIQYLQSKQKVT